MAVRSADQRTLISKTDHALLFVAQDRGRWINCRDLVGRRDDREQLPACPCQDFRLVVMPLAAESRQDVSLSQTAEFLTFLMERSTIPPKEKAMSHKIQRYGWVPDLPDHRDHLYAAPVMHLAALPPSIDLRPQCPAVYDQGQLGSCTGNSIAGAIEFDLKKQGLTDFVPSRLFIYYNERAMEGTVGQDAGAQIRDGIKSVATYGAAPETLWPYDVSKFAVKPPQSVYAQAKQYKAVQYTRVAQNLSQMKGCLASGFPFVFGFSVYESFESQAVAQNGVVPMPSSSEQLLGGHAVLCVGYDDTSQRIIVRNSWGPGWGQAGYFTMPYAYVTQASLADDFWSIRAIQ
jgi:C1A family cysteine protease